MECDCEYADWEDALKDMKFIASFSKNEKRLVRALNELDRTRERVNRNAKEALAEALSPKRFGL